MRIAIHAKASSRVIRVKFDGEATLVKNSLFQKCAGEMKNVRFQFRNELETPKGLMLRSKPANTLKEYPE